MYIYACDPELQARHQNKGAIMKQGTIDRKEEMQYMCGGMVVFLEANNDDKLLKYYNDNRFSQFDTRQTTSKDQEPHELVQLLRLL